MSGWCEWVAISPVGWLSGWLAVWVLPVAGAGAALLQAGDTLLGRSRPMLLPPLHTTNHPSFPSQPSAGNNAVEMETTATFDQATDEFIIHTPSSHGQK